MSAADSQTSASGDHPRQWNLVHHSSHDLLSVAFLRSISTSVPVTNVCLHLNDRYRIPFTASSENPLEYFPVADACSELTPADPLVAKHLLGVQVVALKNYDLAKVTAVGEATFLFNGINLSCDGTLLYHLQN